MKKLALFLILTNFICFSQELISKVNLELDKQTDYFHVVNEKNNTISFFLINKTNIKSVLFNNKLEIETDLSTEKPDKKYKEIIGNGFEGDNSVVYWFDPKNNDVFIQYFDMVKKSVSNKNFKLELGEEKIIKTTCINDAFHIISINKNSNVLNFYSIRNKELTKKTIDLSNKKFINKENKFSTLWDILQEGSSFEKDFTIQGISNETPPSLVLSSSKRKSYLDNNNLLFTFDNNKNYTQIISIDVNQFTASVTSINQPFVRQADISFVDSNSFIIDNKIIQVKLNSNNLIMEIKELNGKSIKQFEISDNIDFQYKNSEIIQENGSVANTRILGKSDQLLRKISRFLPSISCYSEKDKIFLSLGAVSPEESNNSFVYFGGMIGGFTGVLIAEIIDSSFSNNNLNSYANKKVVYINSVFDRNFNHIPGEINKLPFDKLREYAENNKNFNNSIVFNLNGSLFYGGYDKKNKNFSFYKF
jgi:hypothetical protein